MSSLFTTAPDRANSVLLSTPGSSRSRIVVIGTPGPEMCRLLGFLRSLTVKHVLFSNLIQNESGRCSHSGSAVSDALALAVARKWFWSRKTSQGFLLEGFPRNLTQALVFDEWLEARGETLDRVVHLQGYADADNDWAPVALHYRQQSILEAFTMSDRARAVSMNNLTEVALS